MHSRFITKVSSIALGALLFGGCADEEELKTADPLADCVDGQCPGPNDGCGHQDACQPVTWDRTHPWDPNLATGYPSTCYRTTQFGGSVQPGANGTPCDIVYAALGPSYNHNGKLCTDFYVVSVNGPVTQCRGSNGGFVSQGQVYRRCQGDAMNNWGVNLGGGEGYITQLLNISAQAEADLQAKREACKGQLNRATYLFRVAEAEYQKLVMAFENILNDLAIELIKSLLDKFADDGVLGKGANSFWQAMLTIINERINGAPADDPDLWWKGIEEALTTTLSDRIEMRFGCNAGIAAGFAQFLSTILVNEAKAQMQQNNGGVVVVPTNIQQVEQVADAAVGAAIEGLGTAIDKKFPGLGAVIRVELKLLWGEVKTIAKYTEFLLNQSNVKAACDSYTTTFNAVVNANYTGAKLECMRLADRWRDQAPIDTGTRTPPPPCDPADPNCQFVDPPFEGGGCTTTPLPLGLALFSVIASPLLVLLRRRRRST